MKINGKKIDTLEAFETMITVADSCVVPKNKIGTGNGEAKLYISSKETMYSFFGPRGFKINCFMLKKDLISYLTAIKPEYDNPSQDYRGKEKMPNLWEERMTKVMQLDDIIPFTVEDQKHIQGIRGYVNSTDKNYKLLRTIALPLVSYIYIEKVGDYKSPMYYWKLFVDFDTIWETKNGPLVFRYGKGTPTIASKNKDEVTEKIKKEKEITRAREGQGKYREQLLEQCRICPITKIADERLLIASHIKPWAASNDEEKIDPYNGYMLSPLYDKLFDRGFITFTPDKYMITSEFISHYTWKLLKIDPLIPRRISALPMDEKRIQYLEFHHDNVFKGNYTYDE